MLRAQCLVAIIYVSAISCPYETEYDRHATLFKQIIEAATVVIDTKDQNHVQFRPDLGIIQPLLFTGVKYRHGAWRRRAIALLARAGEEGPLVGKVEAAVAKRTMQVEEESFAVGNKEGLVPEDVPERKRLCAQILSNDYYEMNNTTHCGRLTMTRCVDVDFLVSGKESCEKGKHWNVWEEEIQFYNQGSEF